MNFDPTELQKFNELSNRWWDKTGDFRPLHDINPLRLDWIAKWTALAGTNVVDIGCGGGILAESMAAKGANVTGIDLAEKAISVAEKHSAETGIAVRYLTIPVEDLASREPAQFDTVTCMEMLEHVPDPASVINACAKLVKPGGHVFFSTLNRNLKSLLFAIIGAEYILRLLPAGTHEHARFIKPAELSHLARHAGLTVEGLTGITYNPFFGCCHLSSDTSINYIMTCARPR